MNYCKWCFTNENIIWNDIHIYNIIHKWNNVYICKESDRKKKYYLIQEKGIYKPMIMLSLCKECSYKDLIFTFNKVDGKCYLSDKRIGNERITINDDEFEYNDEHYFIDKTDVFGGKKYIIQRK
jgi:hypothetical protein